jgi:hypothetical protein
MTALQLHHRLGIFNVLHQLDLANADCQDWYLLWWIQQIAHFVNLEHQGKMKQFNLLQKASTQYPQIKNLNLYSTFLACSRSPTFKKKKDIALLPNEKNNHVKFLLDSIESEYEPMLKILVFCRVLKSRCTNREYSSCLLRRQNLEAGLATDYIYEFRTGPLSCFARTNFWIVTRSKVGSLLFRDSAKFLNSKFLISNSCFTASQKYTSRQPDESWCSRRLFIPFRKTGNTG